MHTGLCLGDATTGSALSLGCNRKRQPLAKNKQAGTRCSISVCGSAQLAIYLMTAGS